MLVYTGAINICIITSRLLCLEGVDRIVSLINTFHELETFMPILNF